VDREFSTVANDEITNFDSTVQNLLALVMCHFQIGTHAILDLANIIQHNIIHLSFISLQKFFMFICRVVSLVPNISKAQTILITNHIMRNTRDFKI
jgi:hypothetical protein